MYRALGHDPLRAALASHTGTFALVGPAGVGRRGIVAEWAGTRPCEAFTTVAEARRRPEVLQVLDGSDVDSWVPLLRPLEEASFTVAIIAEHLPAPVASRVPVFRVGYLTDAEVTRVLAEQHPTLRPRPLIAALAQGSLAGLDDLRRTAAVVDVLDEALCQGRLNLRRADPLALLGCLRALCRTVLGLVSLPFSTAARAAIPHRAATALLAQPEPGSEHEARNLLALFWARLRG